MHRAWYTDMHAVAAFHVSRARVNLRSKASRQPEQRESARHADTHAYALNGERSNDNNSDDDGLESVPCCKWAGRPLASLSCLSWSAFS